MNKLFWGTLAVIGAVVGTEAYRAKKSGKTLGAQFASDYNAVKTKTAKTLDDLQKKAVQEEPAVDSTACPTCGCQDVAINTDCPNCKKTRTA